VAIPRGITGDDVRQAIGEYDRGVNHGFGPSTRYDLVFLGRRYPPKAIVGLAASRANGGRRLTPADFVGGVGSGAANQVLEQLYYIVVGKGQPMPRTVEGRSLPGTIPSGGPYRGHDIFHHRDTREWSTVLQGHRRRTFRNDRGGLTGVIDEHLDGSPAPSQARQAGGGDWSPIENERIVADYVEMLRSEAAGIPVNKAAHNRQLLPALDGRSRSAVEWKHRNISRVMSDLGLPAIKGYLEAGNIQHSLRDEVQRQVGDGSLIEAAVTAGITAVDTSVPAVADAAPMLPTLVDPPAPIVSKLQNPGSPAGRKIDYGILQAENRALGQRGERVIVNLERQRLTEARRPDLAERISWVARVIGDGLGYDVLSFDTDGTELHVEVKTTKFGAYTPFYLTAAELAVSKDDPHFRLYRLFDLDGDPRYFVLTGSLTGVRLEPVSYRGSFTATDPDPFDAGTGGEPT